MQSVPAVCWRLWVSVDDARLQSKNAFFVVPVLVALDSEGALDHVAVCERVVGRVAFAEPAQEVVAVSVVRVGDVRGEAVCVVCGVEVPV